MTAQQLKNAILQEAIEGRLVPQDPNDEPASILQERIRKEKERLVKEGKLKKKDLEVKPISEDEIPFEIPESWEWCRIGDIFIHASGKQQSSSNKKLGTLQKYITTSNLYWGRFVLDTLKEMYFSDEELKTCSAQKGDLLVCEGGAGYGRSAIWDKDYEICLQNHVHRLRPVISGICEYILYLIYLLKESNRLASVGTAMPGLSANRLKELLVPFPPLAEQKRIVAKIEELLPKVEKYGKAQDELNKLNEELPERLKKSILQEAIEGRLVPQDPNDEPASVLLQKIREEKQKLVKEGKLKKKDLEEKPISEDEIPFEIPESWEWVTLSQISLDSADGPFGSNLKSEHYTTNKEVRIIQLSNIGENGWRDENVKYTTFSHLPSISRSEAFPNDIIIAKMMPAGRAIICPSEDIKYVLSSDAVRFDFSNHLYRKYLYYAINSNIFKDQVYGEVQGITRVRTSLSKLRTYLIPLPPLAEQHRIVEKIEQLFKEIDKLKTK